MKFIGARTQYGEAIHAARDTEFPRPAKTLCGRKISIRGVVVAITDDGIQHPWRCSHCNGVIKRLLAATDNR